MAASERSSHLKTESAIGNDAAGRATTSCVALVWLVFRGVPSTVLGTVSALFLYVSAVVAEPLIIRGRECEQGQVAVPATSFNVGVELGAIDLGAIPRGHPLAVANGILLRRAQCWLSQLRWPVEKGRGSPFWLLPCCLF